MRFLFAFVSRLVLLVLFTFGFVVLFQHGPDKFPDGAKKEWNALVVFVGSMLSRQKSTPASAAPQPAATAAPQPAATAAPQPAATAAASPAPKQSPSPAGAGTNKPATASPTATR
jgi:hypothetical protein